MPILTAGAAKLDYIHGGRGYGPVAQRLIKNGGDPDCLRPFIGKDGRNYVTVIGKDGKKKAVPTNNAALLMRDDWLTMDADVIQMAMPMLRAVGDLRSRAGLSRDINGFANPIIGYQTVSRITPATMSMSGTRKGETDRPEFGEAFLPIPIIHKDFNYDVRQVVAANAHGTSFDNLSMVMAVQEVAILAEKLLIGTLGSYSYGGYTIYGYTNHPLRVTKTYTLPTAAGWTPNTFVEEVIDHKHTLRENLKPGPYALYLSPGWEPYFEKDYSAAYAGESLQTRMEKVKRIVSIETLDYLPDYQVILVSLDPMTVRLIVGMDIKSMQWESPDGMEMFFKVMAILVPQFRFDQANHSGIGHGTAA